MNSVSEYTSCLISLLTLPSVFQFRNYACICHWIVFLTLGREGLECGNQQPTRRNSRRRSWSYIKMILICSKKWTVDTSVIHSLTTALTTHMVHNPKCNNNIVGIGNQPVHVWIFLPKIDTICVFPLTAMPPVRSDCWGTIPWICSPSTWRCHQSSGSDQGSIGNEELTCFFFPGVHPKRFQMNWDYDFGHGLHLV